MRKMNIRDCHGNPTQVTVSIPKATIKMEGDGDKSMWMKPDEVVIPVLSQKQKKIPGILGAKYYRANCPFSYANEFGVQELCKAMVDDALTALGLTDDIVKSHLEISIYMMKPYIMIVMEFLGRIIFVVEVKSPDRKKEDGDNASKNTGGVFESEHVGADLVISLCNESI